MKIIKLCSFFCLFSVILIVFYILVSNMVFININNMLKDSDENSFEKIEKDGLIFFLFYKKPNYSFGSGYKYLYIFSNNKLLLGMCKFGEFPLTIKKITKNEILLEINNFSNIDYVESWIKKNKKIWKYKIIYVKNNNLSPKIKNYRDYESNDVIF